jgi:hypothetical protein
MGQRDLPAVFVDAEDPTRVDVTGVWAERALHHPHPVEFVARDIRVHVPPRQDVLGGEITGVQPIGVVWDVDLALAQELPLEAVGGAGEEVDVVHGAQSVAVGLGKAPRHVGGYWADSPPILVGEPLLGLCQRSYVDGSSATDADGTSQSSAPPAHAMTENVGLA